MLIWQNTGHVCHMSVAKVATMSICLVNVCLQRHVNKKEKKNCVCPICGLNGWCQEDKVIKIENILSEDMTSECSPFCI